MVGDSLEQDCLGPRRFGVQGVWFSPATADAAPPTDVPAVATLGEFAAMVLAARLTAPGLAPAGRN